MIRYECDRCGAPLAENDSNRYIVKMEIYAAVGQLDLDAEATGDVSRQLDDLLENLRNADPTEVEDQTYRSFRFDVCDPCRQAMIKNPLP